MDYTRHFYLKTGLSILLFQLLLFPASSLTDASQSITAAPTRPSFQLIEIPAELSTPEQRADYMIRHYWDLFDFADSSYLLYPEVTEQAFADYLSILEGFPDSTRNRIAISDLLNRAKGSPGMYDLVSSLFEKYLYSPHSPCYNEELYIPVLENIVSWEQKDETEKVRPRYQLKMALRNRVGSRTSDFTFSTANGGEESLYKQNTPYLLLFFYNPDCEKCRETTSQLKSSPSIERLSESGLLNVLALYPDEELSEWLAYRNQLPKNWINGIDKELLIKNEDRYDLRVMPTLYLLDRDKRVLLKAVTPDQLENYLKSIP